MAGDQTKFRQGKKIKDQEKTIKQNKSHPSRRWKLKQQCKPTPTTILLYVAKASLVPKPRRIAHSCNAPTFFWLETLCTLYIQSMGWRLDANSLTCLTTRSEHKGCFLHAFYSSPNARLPQWMNAGRKRYRDRVLPINTYCYQRISSQLHSGRRRYVALLMHTLHQSWYYDRVYIGIHGETQRRHTWFVPK